MSSEIRRDTNASAGKQRAVDPLARRREYVATVAGFACDFLLDSPKEGASVVQGQQVVCAGAVTNNSGGDWRIVVDGERCLQLAAEIRRASDGAKVGVARCRLEGETFRAGETRSFNFQMNTADFDLGEYRMTLDLVYENVCWFHKKERTEPKNVGFMVTPIRAVKKAPGSAFSAEEVRLQIAIEQEICRIQDAARAVDGRALILSGFQAYSQCDEDGILQEIFRRIGTTNRICCELGCGDGLVNNTHYLVMQGWKGVWIDGAARNIAAIRQHVGHSSGPGLSVQEAFITRDNVNDLVGRGLAEILGRSPSAPEPIDFLSLDIDGNDLHVLERLSIVAPRVICVEYNAKFPPPAVIAIRYDEGHVWALDDYQGASLQAFVDLLEPSGYRLVACNASGVNAFFIREADLCDIEVQPVDRLYQPPRYHLIERRQGHRRSYRYLADQLKRENG